MCVRCICVCVVEAANEPPKLGGSSVLCNSVEKLFPFDLLFVLDVIRYFFVTCIYSVDDIRCGEFVSEVVPCAGFLSYVSMECFRKPRLECVVYCYVL